ncbi:Fe-S cluster assembly protein SufD [Pseudanabaena sp. PCC 6802]|uniref:Fe-S cluster assembly protein SufD n=1 Tax=Pseudanabaena sp. PCC 6802 TaxID=118173 RepID=UPI00034DDC79|nr:Fe-S cluster assembly protein SufD [Pseudanabaena sp. PCC 6802]
MTIQVSDSPLGDRSDRLARSNGNSQFLSHVLQLRSEIGAQALDGDVAAQIERLRGIASDRLSFLQVPTTKDEDWKYTDLSNLVKQEFHLPSAAGLETKVQSVVNQHGLLESANSLLVFANGSYISSASHISNLPDGVIVSSLSGLNANIADPTVLNRISQYLDKYLGKHTDAQDTFATLNVACMADAALVYVPKGTILETPIQVISISTHSDVPTIAHPRCLVIAESNSGVTLVETYVGDLDATYFTNTVTEAWLGENARLNHTKVQWESQNAYHIGTTAIAQMRGSSYTSNAIALGAQLSRHNLHIRQVEEQTETHINGLALIGDRQLADTHSCMSHDRPYGTSRQLHKCIAGDRAHAVFNGKIQVAKAAQLTDSAQLSRNLLLSSKAKVDTKPELEIFADNVKCAHGATVSQLDREEIFYLQSRCIDFASAASILTYAFAAEVIERIPVTSLRDKLNSWVLGQTQAQT